MRPESIRRFDLFYLASLALAVIAFFLERRAVIDSVEAAGSGSGVITGSTLVDALFVIWTAFMLLMWFLASRKRWVVAKWIIVALVVLSVFELPGMIRGPLIPATIASWLSFLLSVVAAFFLFRPDARAWFARTTPAEPPAGERP